MLWQWWLLPILHLKLLLPLCTDFLLLYFIWRTGDCTCCPYFLYFPSHSTSSWCVKSLSFFLSRQFSSLLESILVRGQINTVADKWVAPGVQSFSRSFFWRCSQRSLSPLFHHMQNALLWQTCPQPRSIAWCGLLSCSASPFVIHLQC